MYAEIKNSYTYGPAVGDADNENEDLFAAVVIDGWFTDDDNEQGESIATVVMTKHHDVVTVWHNNGARMDGEVLNAINEAKNNLETLWDEQHAAPENENALEIELEELRTIVSTLKQNAEKRVERLNTTGERYYGDCDDPEIQYWRGSGDAYRVMEGHIIAMLKTEEAQTRSNHTIWETYGQFQTDDSTRIICPKCGRKVNVSRKDGEIRGITHCKCRTNGKPTTFKFVYGGGLIYINEKGITIGL